MMSEDAAERVREKVDAFYCSESRRVLATLIRNIRYVVGKVLVDV
jgi:hypothetical protein